jgi:hypothetical protein
MKRVTDLEKFSLEDIWRPYQNQEPFTFEDRLMSAPYNLGDTLRFLQEDTPWSRCVLDRLRGIKPTFPAYIQHPLVDFLREKIKEA